MIEDLAPPTYLPDFDIDSDHKRILYTYREDIWLYDVESGEQRNVTATPERSERMPRWWSNTTDSFLCGSDSRPLEGPALGFLTRVEFTGAYEVLEDRGYLNAPAAPSPDGQSVIYNWFDQGGGVNPSIYQTGQGIVRDFDLSAYGIDWVERVGGASWSLDGNRLAWTLAGRRNGLWQVAEVILDLEAKTNQIVHQYQPVPIDALDPAPQWMPDNKSIIFYDFSTDASVRGLWGADLEEGKTEPLSNQLLNPALTKEPIVSADGRWVIGITPDKKAVGIVDVDTREIHLWPVQNQVSAVGWLSLP